MPQPTTAFKRRSRENEFPGGCANADIAWNAAQGRRLAAGAHDHGRRAATIPNKPVRLIIPFPPGGSNDVVGRADRHPSRRAARQAGGRRQPRPAPAAWSAPRWPRTRRRTATRCWSSRSRTRSIRGSTSCPTTRSRRSRRSRIMALRPERAGRSIPTLPVHSVKELIALAKEKPGELQYASAGVGSFQHLGGELFKLDGRRQHPARAVQGRRPGHDRRDRRPHQDHVLLAGADHAAHQVRQAARARRRRH